jgi:hypothetical protein
LIRPMHALKRPVSGNFERAVHQHCFKYRSA